MTPETRDVPAPDDPIDVERHAWPSAPIDPVVRLRALAAALPHVAIDETVFEAPFERVWELIADLEHTTPRYENAVRQARILERRGDRLVLETRPPIGPWMRFDVVLRSGWCLMRSPIGDVGMAARPEGPDRTRFAHFEGIRALGRLLRPAFAWNVRQDFRRLHALLDSDRS